MYDFWQDEEGIIRSEEETAEEMSSYESEDNQEQVSNKTSTHKINAKINDVSKKKQTKQQQILLKIGK